MYGTVQKHVSQLQAERAEKRRPTHQEFEILSRHAKGRFLQAEHGRSRSSTALDFVPAQQAHSDRNFDHGSQEDLERVQNRTRIM